ncbi:MAG: PIN domain-containing protein [Microthrixaceae bacterium]|nr:PIN domain-containing protein [Microthrixaceae bacterium]
MNHLLDTNVLISLLDSAHESFRASCDWFERLGRREAATCPTVENGALRYLLRTGINASDALETLVEFKQGHRVGFAGEADSMARQSLSGVTGHRQITDVYLGQVARSVNRTLATYDQALCRLRPELTTNLALSAS